MISPGQSYHRYRFRPDIIAHAVRLYFRFSLSFRDVEDLLVQRDITVIYETFQRWCRTFGGAYAQWLRHRRGAVQRGTGLATRMRGVPRRWLGTHCRRLLLESSRRLP